MVKTQSCLSDLFIRHASVHSLNIYWVCFICPELRELLCLSEMIISKKWSGREASTWEFVSIWLGKLRTWMVYFLRAETSCGASLIKVNAHFAHWKISSVIQEEMSSELWKWCTKELNSFCLGYKLFCYCLCLIDGAYPPEFMAHSSLLVHAKPFSSFYLCFPFILPWSHSHSPHRQLQFCIWCLSFFAYIYFYKLFTILLHVFLMRVGGITQYNLILFLSLFSLHTMFLRVLHVAVLKSNLRLLIAAWRPIGFYLCERVSYFEEEI